MKKTAEPLLPCSIEAEGGLLGSLLIDPDALPLVIDVVKPQDFYRNAHESIYQVMLTLASQQMPADLITICDELERRGQLDDVGGAGAIVDLQSRVPTSANAAHYASIVAQKA